MRRYPFRLALLGLLLPHFLLAQYGRPVTGWFSSPVYRQTDGLLYAVTVDQVNFSVTNYRVAAISPTSASVVQQWAPLGKTMLKIGFSSDESKLYCATYDSTYRYDVATGTVDLQFANQLNTTDVTPTPVHFEPVPGQPDALLTNWSLTPTNFEPSGYLVVVYDNGVKRPNTAFNYYDYGAITTDGTTVFAYDTYSTGSGIVPFSLDANGLTPLTDKYHYVNGSSASVRYFDGRVYGFDGTVLTVQPSGQLTPAGRLYTRSDNSSVVRFAPGSDTIYVHSVVGKEVWLQKFDHDNLQLLDEKLLTTVGTADPPSQVIALGSPNVVAVRIQNRIEIVHRCTPQIAVPPSFPSPVVHLCDNDTLQLTAPGNYPSDRYYWSNGVRGQVQPVTWVVDGSQPFTYRVADDNGCLSAPSAPVEVRRAFLPTQVGVWAQFGSVICSGTPVELRAGYNTSNVAQEAMTYHWSDGQVGKSIVVGTPGLYTVRARSNEGCFSEPSATPFEVTTSTSTTPPVPYIAVTNGGSNPFEICSANNTQVVGPTIFAQYWWSDYTSVQTTYQRPAPTVSGPIALRVVTAEGCASAWSPPTNFTYYVSPAKPTVQRAGPTLLSSSPTNNQWYLGSSPISGVTGQFFNPTEPGLYRVRVANGSCGTISDNYPFNN